MIKAIVWDFNGTLLDDAGAAVGAVNLMLGRRGLPPITAEWYVENLIMPLERFYESVGVNVQAEPIEVLSEEFQRDCAQFERPIFPEARAALIRFHQRGIRQMLFSSLHHQVLMEQAAEREILPYFEKIVGREDRSLGGKGEAVAAYLKEAGISPTEALLVGDLTSDWQMAQKLGAPCVLIPKGHQSRRILEEAGAVIAADASELDRFLEE